MDCARLARLSGTLLVLVAGLLAGCSGKSDFADINSFIDEVYARPKSPIEPLPPFEQVQPFSYQASALRSPFEPPVILKRVARSRAEGIQVTPDLNRVKQYLEQYAIAQLSMVGTLEQNGTMFALVKDGDGGVHRVQAGDYMGTDHGRIQSIDEVTIDLLEIVPDGIGGWVERERSVALRGRRG